MKEENKVYWFFHPESDCFFMSTKENMNDGNMMECAEICEAITGQEQEAIDAIQSEAEIYEVKYDKQHKSK